MHHVRRARQPEPLPIGKLKTFGPWGPMYEVLGLGSNGPKGPTVHIGVMFTGEELDYPLTDPFKR